MNILGLIPARGGSKRVLGKNIRHLGDKPTIAWTIEAAKSASCLQNIIVSTDDQAIADLAMKWGAQVPWLRSPELGSDTAQVIDAVIEVLERLDSERAEGPTAVMLLQPTSPFRSAETIRRAVELFKKNGADSVVSVSPAKTHPQWCRRVSEDGILSDFMTGNTVSRSQDLPPVYALNGAIYLADVATLHTRHGFYSDRTRALIMDSDIEALDIDSPFDWMIAETIATKGNISS